MFSLFYLFCLYRRPDQNIRDIVHRVFKETHTAVNTPGLQLDSFSEALSELQLQLTVDVPIDLG